MRAKGEIVVKQCMDCGTDLYVSSWARKVLCPTCKVKHARQYCRNYYNKNTEKFSTKRKKRYEEYKEEDTAKHKEWVRKNSDKVNAATQKWREENRSQWQEYMSTWRKNNRERSHGYDSRRRSAASQAMDTVDRKISLEYRQAIKHDDCFYCGVKPKEHVDHFFPLSKGGNDYWFNLVPTCRNCNQRKKDRCGTWFILRTGMVKLCLN